MQQIFTLQTFFAIPGGEAQRLEVPSDLVRELQRARLAPVLHLDRLVRVGVGNRVDNQLCELSGRGTCIEEGVLQDLQILVAHLPSKAGLVHLRAPHAK